jgi:hypothetical protein
MFIPPVANIAPMSTLQDRSTTSAVSHIAPADQSGLETSSASSTGTTMIWRAAKVVGRPTSEWSTSHDVVIGAVFCRWPAMAPVVTAAMPTTAFVPEPWCQNAGYTK